MDIAEAFLGGARQADEQATNEARRQELMAQTLARYRTGGSPTVLNMWAQPNAAAPGIQSPLNDPSTQVPREMSQVEQGQALPPNMPVGAAGVQPQQGPPSLPDGNLPPPMQGPPRLDPTKYPNSVRAASLPPLSSLPTDTTPPPPDPSQTVPQLQPSMDALDRLRGFYRSEAQKPNGAARAYSELLNSGLSPQESQQVLGFGPLSPDLVNKIASQGQVTLRPMDTGTETADQMAGRSLTEQRNVYGERALSPLVESGYPALPASYNAAIQQEGPGFAGNMYKSDSRAQLDAWKFGAKQAANDPMIASLAKRAQTYSQLDHLIPEQEADLSTIRDQLSVRTPAVQMHAAGMPDAEIQAQFAPGGPYAAFAPIVKSDPALLMFTPGMTGSVSMGGRGPGSGIPGPSQGTPSPNMAGNAPGAGPAKAAVSKNLAPADAPANIRSQWARIDSATRSMMLAATSPTQGHSWADVAATPEVQQALSKASSASRKK